jgi:hypothetical protein
MRSAWAIAAIVFLILVGGAIATMGYLPIHQDRYVLGFAVIGALLGMIILRMRGRLVLNIPIWIVLLIIFSSYCVKLLLIVINPESPVMLGMLPRIGLNNPDMPTLWLNALTLTALGTASFCIVWGIVSYACTWRSAEETIRLRDPWYIRTKLWWWAWSGLFILSLGTAWLSYHFDIGLMGSEIKLALPYRLRGVIFYFRSYVLMGALLMLAYVAYRQKSNSRFWWAIGLLVLNGMADALIRSSKAALLAPFLYVFFLMVAAEMPIRKRYMMLALLICVPMFLALPYLNNLRVFRSAGLGVWEAVAQTISSTEMTPIESLIRWMVWVIYRLPGVEMLIGILGHPTPPIGANWPEIFARSTGVAGFLTNDVFLTPPQHPHLAAPSYFGWWYLMFGRLGVVLGGAVLALFVRFGWQAVLTLGNQAAIIVRIFFLMLLFMIVSEGTLDMLAKTVVAIFITVLILEATMRITSCFSRKYYACAK